MKGEKVALTALHMASRPENMTILGILKVDVQASFLELRSRSGLSNEGLRKRLEDLQRYHMIKGNVSHSEKGVRVTYDLTDLGGRVYRLLLDSLDYMYEMDTRLASNQFVLDMEAFQEIVRISGIRGMRQIFAHSKIILRKVDHGKLKQSAHDKDDLDMELLLNDTSTVSMAPAPSKDKVLTGIEQHLRKAKRLNADYSDLIVTAIGLGASLITDNVSAQSAARSMGVVSAGSANVSNLRGANLLQDIFYEASIDGNISWRNRATVESRHEVLRNIGRVDITPSSITSSYTSRKKVTTSKPLVHRDADRNAALNGVGIPQKDPGHAVCSKEERAIYERLAEKNPIFARKFLGALLAFRQDFALDAHVTREEGAEARHDDRGVQQIPNPDKFSQSAHSMREMLNFLLRGEEPTQSKKPPEVRCQSCGHSQVLNDQKLETDNSNRDRMQRVFDPLNNLPDHFGTIYDELYRLHNWFTGIAHNASATSENEYGANLARYIHIMYLLLNPHFDSATQIDTFAKMKNPKNHDLERVKEMIRGSTVLYNNFFTRAGAGWLQLLAKDGKYFKYVSSEAIKGHKRSYAALPEFNYLERAAASKPSETLKIILDVAIPKKPSKQNPWFIRYLVRAGIAMPPKYAKKVAQKAIDGRWHCAQPSIYHIADLTKLMMHISKTDIKTSLNICTHLLDVTEENVGTLGVPPPYAHYRQIQGLIDDHNYEEIIKKSLPLLADIDNDAVLTMICCKLKKSIAIENKFLLDSTKNPKQQEDISNMWRPAIEDCEQNGHGIQSLLVECIRDLLERSERSGVNALKTSLSIIASYKYPVFRRMEIYIYTRNPECFSDEINDLAIKYFDDYRFKHEYHRMLKACYAYLTSRTKRLLKAKIAHGPARNEHRKDYGEFETDAKKSWRIEKLDPIIEYLPEHRREYEAWIKKHGRPPTIEFVRYSSTTSYKISELPHIPEDSSPKQMIKFLRSYDSQGDLKKFEGLRFKFRDSVKKDPAEYAKLAPKIFLCRNEFHSDFLAGLAKAHDKNIDWRSVLRFCRDVTMSPDNLNSSEFEYLIQACADIFRSNLRNNPGGIPHSMRKRVWCILECCTNVIPHDAMRQETYHRGNGPMYDAMTTSINSVTGVTAHAIVQYAAWHYSNTAKDSKDDARLLPGVRSTLDRLLDPNHPQSVSARAALGYGFAGLFYADKKWATENIETIFTHDEQHGTLGDAAWDSYMANIIYEDVFYSLRQEYEYRIKRLPEDIVHTEYQNRLAEHVGVAYLYGMRNSTKILEMLISCASTDVTGKCLETIGLTMLSPDTKNERKLDLRIDNLLKYKKILSNPSAGWLFVCGGADKDRSIRALNKILENTNGAIDPVWRVTEELESYASSHPLETIQCIKKIIHKYKNDSELLLVTRHLDTIFEAILATHDAQAISSMKTAVDSLGRIGLEQFKRFA